MAGVAASRSAARAAAGPEAARLREACQEFEALFLSMLFREMGAAAPRTGLLSGGAGGELFRGLWVEELGRVAARSSPLGIAELLYRTLSQDAPAGVKPAAESAEDANGRRPGACATPAEDGP